MAETTDKVLMESEDLYNTEDLLSENPVIETLKDLPEDEEVVEEVNEDLDGSITEDVEPMEDDVDPVEEEVEPTEDTELTEAGKNTWAIYYLDIILTGTFLDPETVESTDGEAGDKIKKVPKAISHSRISDLPLSKVKHIIKLDPDVKLVNGDRFFRTYCNDDLILFFLGEALFLITQATELFIKTLAKESFNFAAQQKKKTITKAHVDHALTMLPIEL